MKGMIEYLKITCIGFGSWIASYFQPIRGICVLFLVFCAIDFLTGLLASFSRGQGFRSWKARESFFKLLVYLGCFALIIAIGREVSGIDGPKEISGITTLLKTVIVVAIWFEAKSNAENLRIIFPSIRFIRFVDYILGVEFINKLPWLKNFLDYDNKDGVKRDNETKEQTDKSQTK